MVIPIPYGRSYTTSMSGAAWRVTPCECCGGEFVYRIERRVQASGFSPLFLDNEGASQRAQTRAQTTLQQRLEKECEPVRCPDCGKYQAGMVRQLKARRFQTLQYGSALVVAIQIMIAVFAYFLDNGRFANIMQCLAPPWGVIWMTAAVVLGLTTLLRSRHDPNSTSRRLDRAIPTGLAGPFRRIEFERMVAKAREEAAARGSAVRPVRNGSCAGCGTTLAPGFVGNCPVCQEQQ